VVTVTVPEATAELPPTPAATPEPSPTAAKPTETRREATPVPLTLDALENVEYRGIYEQVVRLTDGSYEGEPFVEGGASRPTVNLTDPHAFGDLNGDGVDDAVVVLVERSGGSGSFVYLAAMINQDGAPENVATQSLGDRAQVRSITIAGSDISVDMVTHGPDDPMCCPTQAVRNVYALQGDILAEVSSEVIGTPEDPHEAGAGLTLDALRNATYLTELEESGTLTLTDGRYEGEPFVEGGATRLVVTLVEPVAFGDVDGDGVEDAAVALVADPGGSGSFTYLAAVIDQDGMGHNVATELLGDRVKIGALSIAGGEIVVDMVTHGPDDPMCCPTQRVVQRYALQGDALVQTASDVLSPAPGSDVGGEDIIGIVWEWQRLSDTPGQEDIVVIYPPNYRLELRPDGYFDVKADCNRGGGVYALDDGGLTLELGRVTLAECGPDSLYDEYMSLLPQVATYVRQGDGLILRLRADGGQMAFSRLHAVTGRIVAPVDAILPERAMLEVKVTDVTQGEPGTQIGGALRDASPFPIAFEAPYNPQAIQASGTYVLEVTIKDGQGNPAFKSPQPYPVLTQGHPTYHVEVTVE